MTTCETCPRTLSATDLEKGCRRCRVCRRLTPGREVLVPRERIQKRTRKPRPQNPNDRLFISERKAERELAEGRESWWTKHAAPGTPAAEFYTEAHQQHPTPSAPRRTSPLAEW